MGPGQGQAAGPAAVRSRGARPSCLLGIPQSARVAGATIRLATKYVSRCPGQGRCPGCAARYLYAMPMRSRLWVRRCRHVRGPAAAQPQSLPSCGCARPPRTRRPLLWRQTHRLPYASAGAEACPVRAAVPQRTAVPKPWARRFLRQPDLPGRPVALPRPVFCRLGASPPLPRSWLAAWPCRQQAAEPPHRERFATHWSLLFAFGDALCRGTLETSGGCFGLSHFPQ